MRYMLRKGIQCSTFNRRDPEYFLSLWSLLYPFLKEQQEKEHFLCVNSLELAASLLNTGSIRAKISFPLYVKLVLQKDVLARLF